MSSLYKKSGGVFYIQLSPSEHAARPKISTGTRAKRDAADFKRNIENLIQARRTGGQLQAYTAEWVKSLSGAMRDRLVSLGLVEPRPEDYKFIDWAELMIKEKEANPNIKPLTIVKYNQTLKKIKVFFRSEKLSDITPQVAEAFRNYMQTVMGLNDNTIRKHISRCKSMIKVAIERDILAKNPFKGLKSNVQANPDRFFYVSPELAAEVLEACPDAHWRLLFGLARFGGLRIPSELQQLTWADVRIDKDYFLVHSVKTEAYEGKAVRQVPITPELKELFTEAFEAAEAGETHVIPARMRKQPSTQFKRILRKTGIKVWPKLFQNCRSTRETELFKLTNGNVKAVCSWIGNSPEIAMKHYAQVTEADLKQAAMAAVVKDDFRGVHNRVHNRTETDGNAEKHNPAISDINPLNFSRLQAVSACCKPLQNIDLYPQGDSNPCYRDENPAS